MEFHFRYFMVFFFRKERKCSKRKIGDIHGNGAIAKTTVHKYFSRKEQEYSNWSLGAVYDQIETLNNMIQVIQNLNTAYKL